MKVSASFIRACDLEGVSYRICDNVVLVSKGGLTCAYNYTEHLDIVEIHREAFQELFK